MIVDLIKQTRSFRRFDQSANVSQETPKGLVEMARHAASARNLQPPKHVLSYKPETNALIFSTLVWTEDPKSWHCPAEGERPSAHIIVLGDTRISTNFDVDSGIASQYIMLGAGGAEKVLKEFDGDLNIPKKDVKTANPDRQLAIN
ncbi:MAG: nitroreductase family protein [Chloroflexota bacterium]|nr:nitroreductase family protein [Chloroflexota bacterium]